MHRDVLRRILRAEARDEGVGAEGGDELGVGGGRASDAEPGGQCGASGVCHGREYLAIVTCMQVAARAG